jgi:predicted Zn-dependent protease
MHTYQRSPSAAEHARAQRIRALGQFLLFASLGVLGLVVASVGGTWFWYASKGKMADLGQMARHGALMTPAAAGGDAYEQFFDTPAKAEAEEKEAKAEREAKAKAEAIRKLREEVRRQDPRITHILALRERIEKWKAEKANQAIADEPVEYRRAGADGG